MEGLRQGRHHHLGVPADRLPLGRPGPPGVRAARLPPRRRVLLVHLLPHPGALPVRARRPAGDVPRGQGPARRPGARLGRHRRRPREGQDATRPPAARAGWCGRRWDEATEIVAAAHVHTIKQWGPDRVAGFSPIPAMSMVSPRRRARGSSSSSAARCSRFYDWYADLPVASPQVFGDQTDVPESGRLVGRRLPDHVGLQPAGHPHSGRALDDRGPLPRAEGHRRLARLRRQREVRRRVAARRARHRRRPGHGDGPRRSSRSSSSTARCRTSATTSPRYTDLPFLVRARPCRADGTGYVPGKFLTAADLGGDEAAARTPPSRRCCSTPRTGEPVVPNGSLGHRFGDERRRQVEPRPRRRRARCSPLTRGTRHGRGATCRGSTTPDGSADGPRARRAGPPGRRSPGHHGVRPAARAVRRRAATASRRLAHRLRRRRRALHPGLAGADHRRARRRPRRASAASSRRTPRTSTGRSMIIMGAGTNHWFHSDTIYRAFLTLTTLTGCQGVNGGGWAHYVGQEKVRPDHRLHPDRQRPGLGPAAAQQMIQTAYWYLHTDQFRYDPFGADTLAAHRRTGRFAGKTHGRRARPVGAPGLDAVLPDVRPQPAGPRRRGGRPRAAGRRPRGRAS